MKISIELNEETKERWETVKRVLEERFEYVYAVNMSL